MATIGQQLTAPEAGWRRYDDTDSALKYSPPLATTTTATANYKSTIKLWSPNALISFRFKGTKIRVIGNTHSGYANNLEIVIDGVKETFSEKSSSSTELAQALVYEKIGLVDTEHTVTLLNPSSTTCILDAIDIDSTGRLLHPDEILSPDELTIGKRIRAHYQAGANQVGTFSGLGEETSDFIPPASSNVPNGDLYFIAVDTMDNGSGMKLIADRNIQSGISWDKINEEGMTSTGREIIL